MFETNCLIEATNGKGMQSEQRERARKKELCKMERINITNDLLVMKMRW
jgi:hypothetical protein